MSTVYASCAVCVTIFSTDGKFWPVANFTKLHALTLAAHSYALLHIVTTTNHHKSYFLSPCEVSTPPSSWIWAVFSNNSIAFSTPSTRTTSNNSLYLGCMKEKEDYRHRNCPTFFEPILAQCLENMVQTIGGPWTRLLQIHMHSDKQKLILARTLSKNQQEMR